MNSINKIIINGFALLGIIGLLTTCGGGGSAVPDYSPQLLGSFQGTDGSSLANVTPAFTPEADGLPGIAESSNNIFGPFGAPTTGKFTIDSGENIFGGSWVSMAGQSTAEGSDTWLRWAMYIPTAFCAGYGSGGDGYGRTKWFRLGWNDAPNADRMTVQLGNFDSSNCNSSELKIPYVSAEFPSEVEIVLPTTGVVPRDTWVFPQIHIYHSYSTSKGWLEMWIGETYLGRGTVGTSNTYRTIGAKGGSPGDDTLNGLHIGDYWNGEAYQNNTWYVDEVIFYNATANPPNTHDSGGRSFIHPDHAVADFQ